MDKDPILYRGPLSPAQAWTGMEAAAENARRLAADAKLLFESKRFPSAASLALLAIEEMGKKYLILEIASKPNEKPGKKWTAYRKHTWKNFFILTMQFVVDEGMSIVNAFRQSLKPENESKRLFYDLLKQRGFYTDCVVANDGGTKWILPTGEINEGMAKLITDLALALAGDGLPDKRYELWNKHMGHEWSEEDWNKFTAEFQSTEDWPWLKSDITEDPDYLKVDQECTTIMRECMKLCEELEPLLRENVDDKYTAKYFVQIENCLTQVTNLLDQATHRKNTPWD